MKLLDIKSVTEAVWAGDKKDFFCLVPFLLKENLMGSKKTFNI